jgi:hypothetical protein
VARRSTSATAHPPTTPTAPKAGAGPVSRRVRLKPQSGRRRRPPGADLPNVWLGVEACGDEVTKRRALLFRLSRVASPRIIYVATRRHAETLAAEVAGHGHCREELGAPFALRQTDGRPLRP